MTRNESTATASPGHRETSRRRFLRTATAAGLFVGVGGVASAQDGGQVEVIELGARIPGWQGQAPASIRGQTNPTLQLQAGTTYEVRIENLDGAPHTFNIEDGDGNVLVQTDRITGQGSTQRVRFAADPAMTEYFCSVHPETMRGSVTVSGQGQETTTTTTPTGAQAFTVRIENVSTDQTLSPSEGGPQPVPLSPGAYAVFSDGNPLFTPGESDRGQGLERIAEDGDPTTLVESLGGQQGVVGFGLFNTPVGTDQPGPIGPGQAYEFVVQGGPEDALTFATMFIPSNDLFFAPGESGISLFDQQGSPVDGDVTDQVQLWDAGTEVNEEPGVGSNQAQRQSGTDTGPAEQEPIQLVADRNDGFTYPAVADVVAVTVSPGVAGAGGNVTGNVTGNETGNATGNATGNVTGNATGNASGNATRNATGGGKSGTTTGTTTSGGPTY